MGCRRDGSTHNDNVIQTACADLALGATSWTSAFVNGTQQSATSATTYVSDVVIWDARSRSDECCIEHTEVGGCRDVRWFDCYCDEWDLGLIVAFGGRSDHGAAVDDSRVLLNNQCSSSLMRGRRIRRSLT